MRRYTQQVSVWAEADGTTPTGDQVPLAVTLVTPPGWAGLPCSLHEGIKEAADQAYSLGYLNVTSGYCYCPPEWGALIPLRAILLDPVNLDPLGNHKAWIVRHTFTRNRFPGTAHTRLLVTLITVRPDGLPA